MGKKRETRIRTIRKRPPSNKEVFSILRPYTATWFKNTFKRFLEPQRYAIPLIKARRNVLIFSPTGSGKTLAAFLGILDELFALGEKGKIEDKVYCVYISPLRALSNDIRKNLQLPLEGITRVAREMEYDLPEIRVFVRHGDTSQSQRARMLKKPPHILITTPESLANMLIAPKFRYKLYDVDWVIVDEVHELSDNKRGVHLSLSLERLQHFAGNFVRIGLSATQAPVKEIAKWLVGFDDDGRPRQCDIVQVLGIKKLDLKVVCPINDLRFRERASKRMYDYLKDVIKKYRTTLIFTNTRAGAEAVAYKLKKELGKRLANRIGVHHSSLGREIRLSVEDGLKTGKLKAVVTSTSLELGIDIGYIDMVVQVGSPRSVIKGLQRIGRAGHAIHRTSRGRFIALDEDDLVELIVLSKCAYDGKLDKITIPQNCLDILAQHLVAMSIEKKWDVNEAYRVIKRSYNFHEIKFEQFMGILEYLAGKYVDLEYQKVYRKLWFDEKEGIFGRKRMARMIYYLNQGAIPDEADYKVYLKKGSRKVWVGNLSEPFVERLIIGDIFVLAGKKYKVLSIKNDRVIVEEAKEENPTVPSWVGEQLPRSFDLSWEIGKFRSNIERFIKKNNIEQAKKWLKERFNADDNTISNVIRYFKEQIDVLGIVPNNKTVVLEMWVDEYQRRHMIFHAAYGRRTCDALSRFFAWVASEKYSCGVGIGITDNGFDLIFPRWVDPDPRDIIKCALQQDFIDVLKKAVRNTELFVNRFRHVANRSFMILKRYKGSEISIKKQRIKASTLVEMLPDDFPIIEETYREVLNDYMDVPHAVEVFEKMKAGTIRIIIANNKPIKILSPFAQNIVLAALSDILTMTDREKWIMSMYEKIKKLMITENSEGSSVEK